MEKKIKKRQILNFFCVFLILWYNIYVSKKVLVVLEFKVIFFPTTSFSGIQGVILFFGIICRKNVKNIFGF
ncbi:hypothetical protein [Anaerotignum neopropionicum]|uniref:hypothetical protein n=1 Tax=Anaerotignum neopropionicum TaxID=36847 RepID=UPI000824FDB9|nr:hypothetical protein [Anaerotignum neopropionicum]